MKTKRIGGMCIAAAALLCLFTGPASAQEDDGGPITQGDDAKYLSVTFVKYKAGRREEAMEIISEYFVPAAEASGTAEPLLAIHFQSGKWDMAVVWELAGGMADLEWYRSPEDIKWFEGLAEIAGGVDEAAAVWASYLDAVADSHTEVGHHHVREAD